MTTTTTTTTTTEWRPGRSRLSPSGTFRVPTGNAMVPLGPRMARLGPRNWGDWDRDWGDWGLFQKATGLYTRATRPTGGNSLAGATDWATGKAPRWGVGDDSQRRVARAGSHSAERVGARHYREPRHFLCVRPLPRCLRYQIRDRLNWV